MDKISYLSKLSCHKLAKNQKNEVLCKASRKEG